MKLLIISVCVNYLDYLRFCFEKNKSTLLNHHYYIITDQNDTATAEFCKKQNINCFLTNEFYYKNSSFNKSRAINDFMLTQQQVLGKLDFEYILLLDSDIIISNLIDDCKFANKNYLLSQNIKFKLPNQNLIESFISLKNKDENCLYGCGRKVFRDINDYNRKIFIRENCRYFGFFQLFHRSKMFFNSEYLVDYCNAAVYDSELLKKFNCKKDLGIDAYHIGLPNMNWNGRHPQSQQWG